MEWLVNNVDTIIGILSVVIVFVVAVLSFFKLAKETQIEKVKEWLLYACIEAEKSLGAHTGQVKLRYVYDLFVEKFKFISMIISFEDFSDLVDESLDKMRELLNDNKDIKSYVENK